MKKIGLILTMGNNSGPLSFSIKNLKATHVTFIGTSSSFEISLDETVKGANLNASQYKTFEVKDTPQEIGILCEKFQNAYKWLQSRGVENIVADPTGGRKWMSAGSVMAASFLGIPMIYIDAEYDSQTKKVKPETMKVVDLGNAYDQTGFVVSAKGRDAFNDGNFEAAAAYFHSIQPTFAHKKEFFSGLALLSDTLAQWDRFEHFDKQIHTTLSASLTKIEHALNSGAGLPSFTGFIKKFDDFLKHLITVEEQKTSTADFIFDLFYNSKRCISRHRYDDAVARQYRTLEAISQFYLSKINFDTSNPDYSILNENQKSLFLSALKNPNELPEKIDLKAGFWLLRVLDSPISSFVFKDPQMSYKYFAFDPFLKSRNLSILAHGFNPIKLSDAEKFDSNLEDFLKNSMSESYSEITSRLNIPVMPEIGF